MKKFIIMFIVSFLSLINIAHAETPKNQNKWYAGIDFNGYQNSNSTILNLENINHKNYYNILKDIFTLNPGFFAGLRVNPYLSFELATDFLINLPNQLKLEIPQISINDVKYITKLTLPIYKKFFLYTKFGTKIFSDKNKKTIHFIRNFPDYKNIIPILSCGLEYLHNNNVSLHVNYDFKHSFSEFLDKKMQTFLDGFNVGVSWKFDNNIENKQLTVHQDYNKNNASINKKYHFLNISKKNNKDFLFPKNNYKNLKLLNNVSKN